MKKIIAILFIILLFFSACEGNKKEAANSLDSAITQTPGVDEAWIPENSIKSVTYEEVILDYEYVRKPPIANWSFFAKKLLTLDDANKWGSSYDLRLADMSGMDLTKDKEELSSIVFDTQTVWPDKLPEGFDPQLIMEIGKNPGLGIRSLHEEGITGKGINIAIIDQPLLLEHQEYGNQIKLYEEINASGEASMHGPFVTSICAGKAIGVAPDVGIYYMGCYDFKSDMKVDFTFLAESIDRILEINKSLPADEKIRAISISAVWCPENRGYDEITEAIGRAKEEGIFVISANMFENYDFWTHGLAKDQLTNPDDTQSYYLYKWDSWMSMIAHVPGCKEYYEKVLNETFDSEMLMIPIGSRTYASPTGADVYAFGISGGWSLMEPYITGLYALACQVKPDITPEEFWAAALETGEVREVIQGGVKYPAKLINPVGLIEILN